MAVALEKRFAVSNDGCVWTPDRFDYAFWRRYLEVFDDVVITARAKQVESAPEGWLRVDGPGVTLLPFPCYIGPREYLDARRMVMKCAAEAVGAADCHILRVPGFIGTAIWKQLEASRKPYAVEVVGDPFDVYSPGAESHPLRPFFRIWSAQLLAAQCRNARFASYVTRNALQARYPASKARHVTHYSSIELRDTDFAVEPRREAANGRELRVVTVGSLAQMYKGVDVLIDALAILARGMKVMPRLTVVGDGKHRRELELRVREARLEENVVFVGHVSDKSKLHEYLDGGDLFVLASRQEGLPRAMIEAMARGLPCVGTTVGGIPELLEPDEVVRPGDAAALARAIEEFAASASRRMIAGERNRNKARDYRDDVLQTRRRDYYRAIRWEAESRRERAGDALMGTRLVYMTTHGNAARWFLRGQLGYMKQRGLDPVVMASPGPDLDTVAGREGVEARPVPFVREMRPARDLRALGCLVAELRRARPHIVNAGTPKAGLLGMIAATACRVPVRVLTLRGLRSETISGPKRLLMEGAERLSCALAHRVVCISPSLRDVCLARGYAPPSKVLVIGHGSSNGIDLERFDRDDVDERAADLRTRLGLPREVPVIGFVGRLTRDKGIEKLYEAFGEVRSRIPSCRLLLVGDFEDGDPVAGEVVEMIGRDPSVSVTGFVDDQEVPSYLRLMSVLAFPSYREGFGNAALEAAASSLPVVGFSVTGVVDAVEDGVTGTLVPAGDAAALARALLRYLESPESARAHGLAGRERAKRLFDQRVVWDGLLDLYRELLAPSRAS